MVILLKIKRIDFFSTRQHSALVSRTVCTWKFRLLYFRNETYYENGNLCKDLLFVYLQPSVNRNSQNLAILTLSFDDVTAKNIYCRTYRVDLPEELGKTIAQECKNCALLRNAFA